MYELSAEEKSQIQKEFDEEFQRIIQSQEFQNKIDEYENSLSNMNNTEIQNRITDFNIIKSDIKALDFQINYYKQMCKKLESVNSSDVQDETEMRKKIEKLQRDKDVVESNAVKRKDAINQKMKLLHDDFSGLFQQVVSLCQVMNNFNEMMNVDIHYDVDESNIEQMKNNGEIFEIFKKLEQNYQQLLSMFSLL